MSKKVSIVLADDHAMVRESLALLLGRTPGIGRVIQAHDGAEAVTAVAREQADIAVLDYSMPGLDGLSAAERILREQPRTRVLILTMHEQLDYAVRALGLGIHGYVLKSGAVLELLDAIRAVLAGDTYVSPEIRAQLASELPERMVRRGGLDTLSAREFEMLRLLGRGLRISDCATAMQVSESTASTYRRRIEQKLGLKSTGEIVRFAVEHGIVG